MKNFAILMFLLVVIFLFLSFDTGRLKVYEPEADNVHITVSEVETNSKVIGMTEVNVILLIAAIGAFILLK